MEQNRTDLLAQFKVRLVWIVVAGVAAAAMAVVVLALTGPVDFHLLLAAVLGTFFSFVLGGSLFAVSFYSARSGYDSGAAEFPTEQSSIGGTNQALPTEAEELARP